MTTRFLLGYDTFSIAIPMCFGGVTGLFRRVRASMGEEGPCSIALTPKVATVSRRWDWVA